jgi:hypothetical protein
MGLSVADGDDEKRNLAISSRWCHIDRQDFALRRHLYTGRPPLPNLIHWLLNKQIQNHGL